MDVVGGYAFDHYHGWKSGRNVSLGLGSVNDVADVITGGGGGSEGVPSTIAVSQVNHPTTTSLYYLYTTSP
jgi:hypothetical protein